MADGHSQLSGVNFFAAVCWQSRSFEVQWVWRNSCCSYFSGNGVWLQNEFFALWWRSDRSILQYQRCEIRRWFLQNKRRRIYTRTNWFFYHSRSYGRRWACLYLFLKWEWNYGRRIQCQHSSLWNWAYGIGLDTDTIINGCIFKASKFPRVRCYFHGGVIQ